jgi:hypothetical protein
LESLSQQLSAKTWQILEGVLEILKAISDSSPRTSLSSNITFSYSQSSVLFQGKLLLKSCLSIANLIVETTGIAKMMHDFAATFLHIFQMLAMTFTVPSE